MELSKQCWADDSRYRADSWPDTSPTDCINPLIQTVGPVRDNVYCKSVLITSAKKVMFSSPPFSLSAKQDTQKNCGMAGHDPGSHRLHFE